MAELFANNAVTTLNGAITAGALSLTVTSATLFPSAAGTFRIKIDSELIKVTAVVGNVFTIVRGDGGTIAASHLSLADVYCIVTKEAIDQLKTDVGVLTGDATGTTAAVVNTQARGLKSATTTVSVSAATAPTSGQVLTATAGTTATWQTPAVPAASQGTVNKLNSADGAGAWLDNSWLCTSAYLGAPGTLPATGTLRVPNGFTMNSVVGGVDRKVLEAGAGAEVIVGGFTGSECAAIYLRAISGGEVRIQVAGSNQLITSTVKHATSIPIVGDSSPYSVHGAVVSAMTDADYTVPASEYSYSLIEVPNGVLSAQRAFKLPTPATEAASYNIGVSNLDAVWGLAVGRADGAGVVYILAAGQRAIFRIRPAGAYLSTSVIL